MRIAALFFAFVALSAWMTVSTVFADDSATTQPDYHRLLILQPDGKPAANARVILTVEYSLCTIVNGQDVTTDPNFRNQPHQFTTAPMARFRFHGKSSPPRLWYCTIPDSRKRMLTGRFQLIRSNFSRGERFAAG